MSPPENLAERTEKYHQYVPAERKRTLEMLREDPVGLRRSLSRWLHKVHDEGKASRRTYNNLLFCERGIKLAEFVALFGAGNFADALSAALRRSPGLSPAEEDSAPRLETGPATDTLGRPTLPGSGEKPAPSSFPEAPVTPDRPRTQSEGASHGLNPLESDPSARQNPLRTTLSAKSRGVGRGLNGVTDTLAATPPPPLPYQWCPKPKNLI